MARIWNYRQDQELPHRALAWYERDANDNPAIIDFSGGWTFTIQIVSSAGAIVKSFADAIVTKQATIPNVTLKWTADAWTSLPPGDYRVHIMAKKTSTGLDDMFDPDDPPILRISATPTV